MTPLHDFFARCGARRRIRACRKEIAISQRSASYQQAIALENSEAFRAEQAKEAQLKADDMRLAEQWHRLWYACSAHSMR
ncbi:MAG: hypothetical protein ACI4MJ_07685 [Aristaeellaceae bacterium]